MQKIKVVVDQDPEAPIEKRVLAKTILEISVSMHKLIGSGLNERAVVCLVHDLSGVGKPDIRAVLKSLKELHKSFCK